MGTQITAFNQAIAENPDKLVVIASSRKDSRNPNGEGAFAVICAPDIADLQKTEERDWKVFCYSWKGENYEIWKGKVIPLTLKELPMMH